MNAPSQYNYSDASQILTGVQSQLFQIYGDLNTQGAHAADQSTDSINLLAGTIKSVAGQINNSTYTKEEKQELLSRINLIGQRTKDIQSSIGNIAGSILETDANVMITQLNASTAQLRLAIQQIERPLKKDLGEIPSVSASSSSSRSAAPLPKLEYPTPVQKAPLGAMERLKRKAGQRVKAVQKHITTKAIAPPDSAAVQTDMEVFRLAMECRDPNRRKELFSSIAKKMGDNYGFLNGQLEFNKDTADIHNNYWQRDAATGNMRLFGRAQELNRFSDDTIFCDMIQYVLENVNPAQADVNNIVNTLAGYFVQYREHDPLFSGRAHGRTMQASLEALAKNPQNWRKNVFEEHKAGCGAAMRSMPIGAKFHGEENREKLVQLAVGSGYVTHTSPLGFLGAVPSALFTALAFEDRPFAEWPREALEATKAGGLAWRAAEQFVNVNDGDEVKYEEQWNEFNHAWHNYIRNRFGDEGLNVSAYADTPAGRDFMNMQSAYLADSPLPREGAETRADWTSAMIVNDTVWPGKSGHDANIIAYDALILTINKFLADNRVESPTIQEIRPSQLKAMLAVASPEARKQFFEDLIERSCMHGGDSDSTGTIAMYWAASCVEEYAVPEELVGHLEKSIFYTPTEARSSSSSSSSVGRGI